MVATQFGDSNPGLQQNTALCLQKLKNLSDRQSLIKKKKKLVCFSQGRGKMPILLKNEVCWDVKSYIRLSSQHFLSVSYPLEATFNTLNYY